MNQVSKDLIGKSVKCRHGHATVAGSDSAKVMSLGKLGKAQKSEDPKSGELLG